MNQSNGTPSTYGNKYKCVNTLTNTCPVDGVRMVDGCKLKTREASAHSEQDYLKQQQDNRVDSKIIVWHSKIIVLG